MPAQFPYPGVPWSQGGMRKVGDSTSNETDMGPEQMTDEDLHQHYVDQIKQGNPIQVPEGEREFNIYMKALDSRKKKDPYQMSPKELRESGAVPKEQPDVDQYGSQTWQGFMREKMQSK